MTDFQLMNVTAANVAARKHGFLMRAEDKHQEAFHFEHSLDSDVVSPRFCIYSNSIYVNGASRRELNFDLWIRRNKGKWRAKAENDRQVQSYADRRKAAQDEFIADVRGFGLFSNNRRELRLAEFDVSSDGNLSVLVSYKALVVPFTATFRVTSPAKAAEIIRALDENILP